MGIYPFYNIYLVRLHRPNHWKSKLELLNITHLYSFHVLAHLIITTALYGRVHLLQLKKLRGKASVPCPRWHRWRVVGSGLGSCPASSNSMLSSLHCASWCCCNSSQSWKQVRLGNLFSSCIVYKEFSQNTVALVRYSLMSLCLYEWVNLQTVVITRNTQTW